MPPVKKFVFIMIDGLGDVAIPHLNGKSPLQYANVPHMDAIAAAGVNGLLDPVQPSLACGSDTAHLSILGYPPSIYYRGRGAFESMGAGLNMVPGDIAFKSNFATLDPATNIVVSRRADRDFEHLGPPLCEALTGISLPSFPNHRVDVQYATEHRCGVRVRGPGLTDMISSTDPLKDNLPLLQAQPLDQSPEAITTAKLVNELSREMHLALERHPINQSRHAAGKPVANVVLLRGCGSLIEAPTFQAKHNLRPFIIAPTAIIAGLAMSLGIDIIKAPGATGDYRSNFMSKARTLITNISNPEKQYEFGFLHVKAVDDAGHDRNVNLKVKFLEDIDKMVGCIIQELSHHESDSSGSEYFICVTGDHSTPVLTGDHSYEPVPFAIAKIQNSNIQLTSTNLNNNTNNNNNNNIKDKVQFFSEIDAAKGLLGRFSGDSIMGIIKNYMKLY